MSITKRPYNSSYSGENLAQVAFPLGGMGAGMICLEGCGALSHVSLRHQPDVYHEPLIFSALSLKSPSGHLARVLEGPVPMWKLCLPGAANGSSGKSYGLPRFAQASFASRFPFGVVSLQDPALPVTVQITGWSPFTPGHSDDSSLPLAALEYTFHNRSSEPLEAVYSFHARNFMQDNSLQKLPEADRPSHGVRPTPGGFILYQNGNSAQPWSQGSFLATTDASGARGNCRWFRGGWFDSLTLIWKSIVEAQLPQADAYTEGDPSSGGSLYVPLSLPPVAQVTLRLLLAWYVPHSNLRAGKGKDDQPANTGTCACGGACPPAVQPPAYQPWYAGRFTDIDETGTFWRQQYSRLRQSSQTFTNCFYNSTLPPEVVEAAAANLSILKSPTIMRQIDGRLWLWEGCGDGSGCCHGSCTHVWNYAQALAHLFPDLERSLRETEFQQCQDDKGHQNFRAPLAIRPADHAFHAAADGQLGGIIKLYRDWRISGDTPWLRQLWPQALASMDYCIATWDPDEKGILQEPHHNTYDIEFWGPDGMCGSFYAAALQAIYLMGQALQHDVQRYASLYRKSRTYLETELFDGEYFIQKIRWEDLRAAIPTTTQACNCNYSPEAKALLQQEGPKYQYGIGCLSDGVLGAFLAAVAGMDAPLDVQKLRSHLLAIHKYNFRTDLSTHANPQRPSYALGAEAGLLLCSWPKGGELSLPFVYSNEVWTGIEYQVAAHLILLGCIDQGLQIVCAVRDRYDGRVRNPFDEYECGHWYGRALSSYALLQACTGQRYDAVDKVLYLKPQLGPNWQSFIATAGGFGTVGMRGGKPFLEVQQGTIELKRIEVLP